MGEAEETKMSEALYLLDQFISKSELGPALQERRKQALKDLFNQILTLDGKAGISAMRDSETTIIFGVGATAKCVVLTPDYYGNGIRYGTDPKASQTELIKGLRFNAATFKFEGTADDEFYVPIPGEPRQRKRDALAVIVEALLPHLG